MGNLARGRFAIALRYDGAGRVATSHAVACAGTPVAFARRNGDNR